MENVTRLTHQDYTIGWICALEVEFTAARGMLDEEHNDLPAAIQDTNIYTLGRIGSHNIVIASLPTGSIGIVSAATVAADLLRSFSQIRFGLMVGIGGGAPKIPEHDPYNDIRLGDVVVSAPYNTSGGVVHYDYNITLDGGKTIRIGHLNAPPAILMNSVTKLRSDINLKDYRIRQHWETMLQEYPKLRKRGHVYPGAAADRLFRSDYAHIGKETDCQQCADSHTVPREPRHEPECPEIHYGLIGSTNQLMMSATRRDELRDSDEILCFEMESSGLMNDFPCVVIRGICDYCDGHKNKIWQPYAAGMAAAYAKALLAIIPSDAVHDQILARDVLAADIREISSTSKTIQAAVEKIAVDALYERLPYAAGATFDAAEDEHATDQRCLAGTRVALLQKIRDWISSNTRKSVFWLNGAAGTGKSTISRTVAAEFAASEQLGASFFFKRGERDRGHASRFFTTVAIQLASSVPELRHIIERAIKKDRHIGDKSIKDHFNELIFRPLTTAHTKAPKLILLVVDALDECDRDTHMQTVVDLLVKIQNNSSFDIRILLTSRPELPLRMGFQQLTSDQYESLVLQEIDPTIVKEDFALYLGHHFSTIPASSVGTSQPWPSKNDTASLIDMAYPLFIFAATIYRFISDPRWEPEQQLEYLLRHKVTTLDVMTRTYIPVFHRLLEGESLRQPDLIRELRMILGPLAVLAEPLSRKALAILLGVRDTIIATRLQTLHAVLDAPDDANAPVRLYHLSFSDFLLDETRQDFKEFYIKRETAHHDLAQRCLMNLLSTPQLKKDICGLSASEHQQGGILGNSLADSISSEIQYACCHWVLHLSRAGPIACPLQLQLSEFLRKRFLPWLEAMSLLRRVSESVSMMHTLLALVYEENDDKTIEQELQNYISDAYRFVVFNKTTIEEHPLQVYTSALVFAPGGSIMRRTYERYLPDWLAKMYDSKVTWKHVVQRLGHDGYYDDATHLALSSKEMLACAHGKTTIILWDTSAGTKQHEIEAPFPILALAFTKDDYYLVSASGKGVISYWNTTSGDLRREMTDDQLPDSPSNRSEAESPVTAFALMPNDVPVSALYSGAIKIWDASSGRLLQTIAAHQQPIRCLVPTKLGNLVSASGYGDIRVWSGSTWTLMHTMDLGSCMGLREHCWLRLAISPDEAHLAVTGMAESKTLAVVMDLKKRHVLKLLVRNADELPGSGTSIAYSQHDNILVVSTLRGLELFDTSDYARIGIYDEPEYGDTLGRQSPSVVAFNSIGFLASTAQFGMIIMSYLDPVGESVTKETDHEEAIVDVRFSDDGQLLATITERGPVKIWRMDPLELVWSIERDIETSSILFSADGQFLAVNSWSHTSLYGVASRTLLQNFDKLKAESFSTDSRLMVCSSHDKRIIIGNIQTRTLHLVIPMSQRKGAYLLAALSGDGTLLAVVWKKSTEIWDTESSLIVQEIDHEDINPTSIGWTFDKSMIAMATMSEGSIRMFEVSTGTLIDTIQTPYVYGTTTLVRNLRMHPSLPYIETNLGRFKFDPISSSTTYSSGARLETFNYCLIGQHAWIQKNGEKLLRLPDDYLGAVFDNNGGRFAFGLRSGRIVVLELRGGSHIEDSHEVNKR